jgi:hypothetical protein
MAAWDRALAIEPGYFSIVEREADIIDGEKAAWKRSRAALRR